MHIITTKSSPIIKVEIKEKSIAQKVISSIKKEFINSFAIKVRIQPIIEDIKIRMKWFIVKVKYIFLLGIPTSFFIYISFILPEIHRRVISNEFISSSISTIIIAELIKLESSELIIDKLSEIDDKKHMIKNTDEKNNIKIGDLLKNCLILIPPKIFGE